MGYLITALLKISRRMWQWKNFENRSVFDEVMCRLRWLTFFGPPCSLWRCILQESVVLSDSVRIRQFDANCAVIITVMRSRLLYKHMLDHNALRLCLHGYMVVARSLQQCVASLLLQWNVWFSIVTIFTVFLSNPLILSQNLIKCSCSFRLIVVLACSSTLPVFCYFCIWLCSVC